MVAKTCAKYGLNTVLVEREEYPARPNVLGCLIQPRLWDYLKMDINMYLNAREGIYKVVLKNRRFLACHESPIRQHVDCYCRV